MIKTAWQELPTRSNENFSHRHEASAMHNIGTGWSDPAARYGATHGVCRCGEPVTQLVEEGMNSVTNWHPFRTDAELVEIEAASVEAYAMSQRRVMR